MITFLHISDKIICISHIFHAAPSLFHFSPFWMISVPKQEFHILNIAYRLNMTCRRSLEYRFNMDSVVIFKSNMMSAELVRPFRVPCKFILPSIPFSDILFYEVQTKPTLFIDVCYKQGCRSQNIWRNNSERCWNHREVSNPDTNWIHRFVFHQLTFRNICDPSCYSSVTTSINFFSRFTNNNLKNYYVFLFEI